MTWTREILGQLYTVSQKTSPLWQAVVLTARFILITLHFQNLNAHSTFLVSSLLLTLFAFKQLRRKKMMQNNSFSLTH